MAITNRQIVNYEWLNQNSLRAYPLADDTTSLDVTGSFTLPTDLIVDLVWPINIELALNPAGFFISNVSVFAHGITLTFSYTDGSTTQTMGVASVAVSGHTPNASYYISGQGNFAGSVGLVTVGRLDTILQSGGSFDFNITGTRILGTCIRPDIRGVKSLQVVNESETTERLYGNIIFESGQNVRIAVQDNGTEYVIRFDALVSADLNTVCGCVNERTVGPPVRTINGIGPNSNGELSITQGTCFDIDAADAENSLKINNTCSQPCCGSNELEIVRTDLNALMQDTRAVLRLVQNLESAYAQLSSAKSAIQNTGVLGNSNALDDLT